MRLFLTFSRGLPFFFTGTSSPTDWLGQSQRRYLRWLSCKICGPSLLFELVLDGAFCILVLISVGLVRAESRLKYQRWPTWTTCMPQISLKSLSVGHLFIECWSCAPSLSFSSFFCRWLQGNSLSGTIPSQISTLTELSQLYAPGSEPFIECWSHDLLSVL